MCLVFVRGWRVCVCFGSFFSVIVSQFFFNLKLLRPPQPPKIVMIVKKYIEIITRWEFQSGVCVKV